MNQRWSLGFLGLALATGLGSCHSTPKNRGSSPGPDSRVEGPGTDTAPSREIEGEPILQLLEHDDIPAIDDPRFVSAEEGDAFLEPGETVLGVIGRNGTPRAYSAWHLDRHEIVNDVLDGDPIAATW